MVHPSLLPCRHLFHLGAGSALAALTLLPWGWAVGIMGGLGALAVAAELARLRIPWLGRRLVGWVRPLLKPQEAHRVTGASFLAWGALLALLLFGQEASRVGILIQAWGDPAGAVVGTLWGRHRIRCLKSLEGSLAYFVGAYLAIGALTTLGWGVPWWAGVAGVGSATLVEALSPPPDDNLWGPTVAAAGVWTVTHLLLTLGL